MSISSHLKNIQHKIKSHSPYHEVRLIGVSKYHNENKLKEAYQAGIRNFGESYLQEALTKISALSDFKDIVWHFIGPIQSKKSKQIAENFDWVQSVSREKVALKLNNSRPQNLNPLNVLVQVNISNDSEKSGLSIDEAEALALKITNLQHLRLRGIMCIPANYENDLQIGEEDGEDAWKGWDEG